MSPKENGTEIIKVLGVSPYSMWLYLKKRNFIRPTLEQMAYDFQRSTKTIRVWIHKLEEHGYIP